MANSGLSSVIQIVQSAMVRTRLGIPRPAPSLFFYPGLSSKPIYQKSSFGFEEVLSVNTPTILLEYLGLRKHNSSDYDATTEHKLHNGNWDWNSYILKGKRSADFAVKCPRTTEILESLENPSLMVNTPFSFAFFSTLGPHSTIQSHFGPCNLRLRCHLPLIVPEGDCALKVGNEVIRWKVGHPIIFDDSYEHQVWNNTDSDRVVLLFDMWHPDLHGDEILAIIELFQSAKNNGWLK